MKNISNFLNAHRKTCRIVDEKEIPPFLKIPFILKGYRINFDFYNCLCSLFLFHNETVNVWTHLIPTLCYSVWFLTLLRSYYYFVSVETKLFDLLEFLYLIAVVITTFCSSIFHLFNCISPKLHKQLRTLDFICISFLILGSTWPVMVYSFICNSGMLIANSIIDGLFSVIGVLMPFFNLIHDSKFRWLRIIVYVTMGLMPAFCWIQLALTEGFDHPLIELMFKNVGYAYIFYGVGVVIYSMRVPERLSPGTFDYLCQSHHIWHLLVNLGIMFMHKGIMSGKEWRINHGSECYSSHSILLKQ
eukprot:TRINITY_DN11718_c0_g1_i1.p1 TRINITY_DN11718_c0_g1~~TRINITY_DN11718_c0_g1_i1.p1  ORF type:complete len:302 (-),score=6.76 TRINITY_DN11718_c0_g1_i1:31-936(-)